MQSLVGLKSCIYLYIQEPIARSMQYSCHDVFTDRSIFSVNLTRIQTPAGTSVTDHKQRLNFMYLVFYYVNMCT